MTYFDAANEAEMDEAGAVAGDPRRCPIHGEVTSSADGMFDGLCGACEYDIDAYDDDFAASPDYDRAVEAMREDIREAEAFQYGEDIIDF